MSDRNSAIISEYVQIGIISPQDIKRLQTSHGLSDRETQDIVSELIARDVWILADDKADYLATVQTSVFYRERRRYNCLYNEFPLYRLLRVFLAVPREVVDVRLAWFRSVPSGQQYLKELVRLRLISASETRDQVHLSAAFKDLQAAINSYLSAGYVPGLKHSWERVAQEDSEALTAAMCSSPFFSTIVLPKLRDYYLSLPEIEKLVTWIADCARQPPSMCDIIGQALHRQECHELWWTLLGDMPSSALTAIEKATDVCFRCLKIAECTPHFSGGYDRRTIRTLLRQYRDEVAANFLREVSAANNDFMVSELANHALLVKFAILPSAVHSAKSFLAEIGVLNSESAILRKDMGSYCPWRDIWLLQKPLWHGQHEHIQGEPHV